MIQDKAQSAGNGMSFSRKYQAVSPKKKRPGNRGSFPDCGHLINQVTTIPQMGQFAIPLRTLTFPATPLIAAFPIYCPICTFSSN